MTLSSSDMFGESSGLTLKQNGVTWKVTTNKGEIKTYNLTYNGQQFGVKNKPWNGTFSTSGIVGNITKVAVAANTGGSANLSVKVGNTDFLCSKKSTADVIKNTKGINTYTFEGNAAGEVVVSLNGTKAACYLGSITVTYEDDGKTATTLSFPTSSYTYEVGQDKGTVIIDNNAAVLKDKEGNVISDATGKITYSVESSVTDLAILGSNENSSDIIVDTNNSGTATVTATFAGDDTYAASKVSYTINVKKVINVIKSIADLKLQLDNTGKTFTLKLTDAVVSYVYGDRAYLEDASAGIQVY